ncbi:EAL domain-containing protein [Marinospirillum alkaliphilum]|uniref:EAL domain-containing protein n=1 Tax=Marinospirillum alkaliphilum DSM 21637 TaxID=1122209 RepID=A0A1K1UA76_9GAMM|nr:EAL domain-containing protein [Marinospirillum alkaliphilum]SFX09726.1 EAL domain-containing protein [Marinospirillum alkaliphilum DSM 21637]
MNKIWMFEALDYHKRLIPLLTLPLLLLLIVGVILLGELKSALSSGQVSMHDQPKIHIPSSEVHSVEALMRWNHPTRGNVPPGAFIPRAEQSTLINRITEFALDQAMQQPAHAG